MTKKIKTKIYKLVWLAASQVGYEWLKIAKPVADVMGLDISAIITLSEEAQTIMYDGIPLYKWFEFGIPVYKIKNINNELELFYNLKPDIVIVGGWRQVIKTGILEMVPFGFVGFHPTLLPFGRGPSPIINSILEGVKESGLTMFFYNNELDAGDIIEQIPFTIEDFDYAFDVYKKEIETGKVLIANLLKYIMAGKIPRIPQDHSKAYYFRKRKLSENQILIRPTTKTNDVYRKIRALSKPYKGAWMSLPGNFKLIIWKADIIPIDFGRKVGEIFKLCCNYFGIQLYDGLIILKEYELISNKGERLSLKDYFKMQNGR